MLPRAAEVCLAAVEGAAEHTGLGGEGVRRSGARPRGRGAGQYGTTPPPPVFPGATIFEVDPPHLAFLNSPGGRQKSGYGLKVGAPEVLSDDPIFGVYLVLPESLENDPATGSIPSCLDVSVSSAILTSSVFHAHSKYLFFIRWLCSLTRPLPHPAHHPWELHMVFLLFKWQNCGRVVLGPFSQ